MKKLAHLIKAVVFLALIYLIIVSLTGIFRSKFSDEMSPGYYDYDRGTFDVIFLGPSTIMDSVLPMELLRDYGIIGYNLGSSAQSSELSYYLAKETIERDHPSLIVLDTGRVNASRADNDTVIMHYVTDNMPFFSSSRSAMIHTVPDLRDRIALYFPLDIYHTRWKELDSSDYDLSYRLSSLGASTAGKQSLDPAQYEDAEIKDETPMTDVHLEWLQKTIDLCKDTGTQLLLVRVPICGVHVSQRNYNERRNADAKVSEIADENGLIFLNLFDDAETVGIDRRKDSIDGQHLNYTGAVKYTDYLGKFITENYIVDDVSADPEYDAIRETYPEYRRALWDQVLTTSTNIPSIVDYLDLAKDETHYLTVVVLNKKTSSLTADNVSALSALGIRQNITGMTSGNYFAVFDEGKLVYELPFSPNTMSTSFKQDVDGITVEIASSAVSGNEGASVRFNGADSGIDPDTAALDIVIYDKDSGEVAAIRPFV